jgi:hypothetical protein
VGARDRDAAAGARFGVDARIAPACADDQFEVGQRLDHLRREARALSHGNKHLIRLESADELVGISDVLRK